VGYKEQPHSSSSGTIITIVTIVTLLLLGGLVVLGLVAGIFFWRLSAAPQPAFPEPPRVVSETRSIVVGTKEAVELGPERPVQATSGMYPYYADVRRITVQLDPQGTILADGQAVDIDGLKDLLVKARPNSKIRLDVIIEVDRRCVFEHVAAVQAICKEVGIENVDIQASNAAPG
jgi:biopolymer transport protein ExbD